MYDILCIILVVLEIWVVIILNFLYLKNV